MRASLGATSRSAAITAILGWAALGLLLEPLAAAAQQGPIRLFPEQLAPATPPAELRPNLPGEAPTPSPAPSPETEAPAPRSLPDEPPGDFRVEGLEAPALDVIGLAGPSEGGLETDLWQGADPALVLALLADLPVLTDNPPLRRLTWRVLVTGAPLPGAPDPSQVLAVRVERLLAMGDLDSAKTLLDRVPPANGDSVLARLAVEVALLLEDDQGACTRANEIGPSSAPIWAQIAVYCHLAAGNAASARLSLDLLRDAGEVDDGAFFQLASALIEGEDSGVPPDLVEPTAIHLALLRMAGLALPAALVPGVTPEVASAVARDAVLAGELRLEIAEHAFATGGMDAAAVAELYAGVGPMEDGDLLARIRVDWGPAIRAQVYRELQTTTDPVARAPLLATSWQSAHGRERFLVAEVYDAAWADLPIRRDLVRLAASSARALLAADRPVLAARWYALLESESDQNAAAREAAAELAPLFALAGLGGRSTVPRMDREQIAAWQARLTDAGFARERMFALLDGVGSPVPAAAWYALVVPPLTRSETVPVPAVWRGLERALVRENRGEALLFALHMLGGRPDAVHAEALVAGLGTLGTIGLDREARAIALATAIGLGL